MAVSGGQLVLHLPEQWRREHPLTMADLHRETLALRAIGLHFAMEGEEVRIGV